MPSPLQQSAELIPLGHVPGYIPSNPHRSTVWRWALRGIWSGGRVLKLKSRTVGGRRYTTLADIECFLTACNDCEVSRG